MVRKISRAVSSVRAKPAAKKGKRTSRHRPDSEIDFSDIPELTQHQLKQGRRVGRPTHGRAAKQLIAIRLDPDLIAALRKRAAIEKVGYQILIQNILTKALLV